jgi:hypothetical protein
MSRIRNTPTFTSLHLASTWLVAFPLLTFLPPSFYLVPTRLQLYQSFQFSVADPDQIKRQDPDTDPHQDDKLDPDPH